MTEHDVRDKTLQRIHHPARPSSAPRAHDAVHPHAWSRRGGWEGGQAPPLPR